MNLAELRAEMAKHRELLEKVRVGCLWTHRQVAHSQRQIAKAQRVLAAIQRFQLRAASIERCNRKPHP